MSDLFELLDAAAGPEPVVVPGVVEDDVTRGRRALRRRRLAGAGAALTAAAAIGVATTGAGPLPGLGASAGPGGTTVSPSPAPDRIAVPPLGPAPAYARSELLVVHPGLVPRGWLVSGDAKVTGIGPENPEREARGYSRVTVSLSGHRLAADRLAALRAVAEPLRVGAHDAWLVRTGDDRAFYVELGDGLVLAADVPRDFAMSQDVVVELLAAVTVDADRVPADDRWTGPPTPGQGG